MSPLRRIWDWLRRLLGRPRQAPETPPERLTRAQLARQLAVRRTEHRRLAWHEAQRALAQAGQTGDANVGERARHDARVAHDDYEAAQADERAARDDVDAAKAALPPEAEPVAVTAGELDAVMESRYKAHASRRERQDALAVHRALDREMQRDLARDHGVVRDQAPPEPAAERQAAAADHEEKVPA